MERVAFDIPSLRSYERIAIFIMLFSLSTCAVISFSSRSKNSSDVRATFSMQVVGEVTEERVLQVPQGATVADVLSYVQCTKFADLEKMAHDAPIASGQTLIVPRKGSLSVFVKGAVEKNEVLVFEEGATFSDLHERVKLDQKADIRSFLRKKRALKEGETVCVRFLK